MVKRNLKLLFQRESTMSATHFVFNSSEVRFIEQDYAKNHQGHCFDLMTKAGVGVYNQLLKKCATPKLVWIFVGKGNNGGDGYIVAQCLLNSKIAHRVFAIGMPYPGTEAFKAYEAYRSLGGKVEIALPTESKIKPTVVVDALLGTGISSAPRSPVDEWILFINRLNVFTISIDVPSGVNADTGAVEGDCVQANLTVATLALKPGLLTSEAVDYVGEVVLEDLGVDLQSYYGMLQNEIENAAPFPILSQTFEDIEDDLPVRLSSANKGDSGKVLIIGGDRGFGGASMLCAMGAMRAGAGLVKVATDPSNVQALNSLMPEVMTVDFYDNQMLSKALAWADVVAIGPGLGTSTRARELVLLVENLDKSLIFDADALNILALDGGFCRHRILTPHPGEAARLLSCTVSEINQDRLQACARLAEKYGGVVLLKGAGSIVCDGRTLTIIKEGSPSMATGGMGDLLTGITSALLAQGLSLQTAMVSAACLHGRAGFLAGQNGIIGTIATDLLPFVKTLVNGRMRLKPR